MKNFGKSRASNSANNPASNPRSANRRDSARRGGFTLVQLLVAGGLLSLLAALTMGVLAPSRASARRAQCDVRLKANVMALDAFRQENGRFPESLRELVEKKYLTDATLLRCPSDPRPDGSYEDGYLTRAARDKDELPILVCSLCESQGERGIQAFKGRYTKQFQTRPAELTAASGATVERPGKNPIAGRAGMLLRGGDNIRTAPGGSATLRFADGSESVIGSGSEVRVLQSFIAGHDRAPLYTLLRQSAGDVLYRVHHGSKFDVTTPTATAGALGTEFRITEDSAGEWRLKVIESKVYCSDAQGTDLYTPLSTTVPSENPGEIPITQTNDWIDLGQSEVVVVQTATSNTPAKTKKRKKRNRRR